MEKTEQAPAGGAPSHIILLAPWKAFPAGKVFAASVDLLAILDRDGIGHRAAEASERHIGGFPD